MVDFKDTLATCRDYAFYTQLKNRSIFPTIPDQLF